MTRTMRPELPPLPERLQHLPIDDRGYPVPFFVAYIDGKPDHRIADAEKFVRCRNENLCWMCGRRLGTYQAFTIGPMCAVNRITSESPQHLECARYAVQACPFLTRPHAKYRDAGKPEESYAPGGFGLSRNPGVVLLWVTKTFRLEMIPNPDGQRGYLFQLGEPTLLEAWSQGRRATTEELVTSIDTGLPTLRAVAEAEGPDAVAEFDGAVDRARRLLGVG